MFQHFYDNLIGDKCYDVSIKTNTDRIFNRRWRCVILISCCVIDDILPMTATVWNAYLRNLESCFFSRSLRPPHSIGHWQGLEMEKNKSQIYEIQFASAHLLSGLFFIGVTCNEYLRNIKVKVLFTTNVL